GFDDKAAGPLVNQDWERLPPAQQERLWIERAWQALDSVDEEVANRIISADPTQAVPAVVGSDGTWYRISSEDSGILSLVVRQEANGRLWTPVPFLARTNPWLWRGAEEGSIFSAAITGLFLIAIVLVLIGAILIMVMREMAAAATIEATTRLRRAVYHHTFRL